MAPLVEHPRYLTLAQVCSELGVNKTELASGWIKAGLLRAANVGRAGGTRPTYRIRREDLDAFIASRTAIPAAKSERRSRRRKLAYVTRYF